MSQSVSSRVYCREERERKEAEKCDCQCHGKGDTRDRLYSAKEYIYSTINTHELVMVFINGVHRQLSHRSRESPVFCDSSYLKNIYLFSLVRITV